MTKLEEDWLPARTLRLPGLRSRLNLLGIAFDEKKNSPSTAGGVVRSKQAVSNHRSLRSAPKSCTTCPRARNRRAGRNCRAGNVRRPKETVEREKTAEPQRTVEREGAVGPEEIVERERSAEPQRIVERERTKSVEPASHGTKSTVGTKKPQGPPQRKRVNKPASQLTGSAKASKDAKPSRDCWKPSSKHNIEALKSILTRHHVPFKHKANAKGKIGRDVLVPLYNKLKERVESADKTEVSGPSNGQARDTQTPVHSKDSDLSLPQSAANILPRNGKSPSVVGTTSLSATVSDPSKGKGKARDSQAPALPSPAADIHPPGNGKAPSDILPGHSKSPSVVGTTSIPAAVSDPSKGKGKARDNQAPDLSSSAADIHPPGNGKAPSVVGTASLLSDLSEDNARKNQAPTQSKDPIISLPRLAADIQASVQSGSSLKHTPSGEVETKNVSGRRLIKLELEKLKKRSRMAREYARQI
ncbi:hypothetical protein PtB15_5B298 [Puccinia triticina]|nr:hypothetical protein PtB15_5B298 [Puccinia triticina]